MEKNIFEGAKFGDKFLTINNEKAIYLRQYGTKDSYMCFIEDDSEITYYNHNGFIAGEDAPSEFDIVSKYHEEINEEKLDNLSGDYMDSLNPQEGVDYGIWEIGDAFKAGYRKAKED